MVPLAALDLAVLPFACMGFIAAAGRLGPAGAPGLAVAGAAEVVAVVAGLEVGDAGGRQQRPRRPGEAPSRAGADGAHAGRGLARLHNHDHDLGVRRGSLSNIGLLFC